jgi:DNA-binding transcriptional ArsR family regulator
MTSPSSSKPENGSRLDEIFVALSDETRRQILLAVAEYDSRTDTGVALRDIVGGSKASDHLIIDLYHNYLPHLDDSGFIDWNRKTNTISPGPRFEEIRPLVRILRDYQGEIPDDRS